jgi:hypothetical protein
MFSVSWPDGKSFPGTFADVDKEEVTLIHIQSHMRKWLAKVREREKLSPKFNPPSLLELCLIHISENALQTAFSTSNQKEMYSYKNLNSVIPKHLKRRLGQKFAKHAEGVTNRIRTERQTNPKLYKTRCFYSDLFDVAWQVGNSSACFKGNKLGEEEARIITYLYKSADQVEVLDLQWNQLRVQLIHCISFCFRVYLSFPTIQGKGLENHSRLFLEQYDTYKTGSILEFNRWRRCSRAVDITFKKYVYKGTSFDRK